MVEDDTYQTDKMKSQFRVKKKFLRARYKLLALVRAQRNDGMTNSLKRWIENGKTVHQVKMI